MLYEVITKNNIVSARRMELTMYIMESSLQNHKEWQGKIEIVSRVKLAGRETLSNAYTPGVARPCLEIERNPELSYELTSYNFV